LKSLPTIFALTLAVLLTVAPLTANAAGIVTFTSPTAGATLSGAYVISGTVSPAQTGPDQVFIKITNPSGAIVNVYDTPATENTGAFSQSATTGSGSEWISGIYTITATDSYSATGSTTFNFVAVAPPPPTSSVFLQVSAVASNPVMPGDTVEVSALVAWSNGTAASSATFSGWWISPAGTATKLTATPSAPAGTTGVWWWSIPVSSSAADGLNAIVLGATVGKTTAWTQTSFTVDSSFASSAGLASINSALSSLQSSMAGNFTSLGSTLSGITSSLGTLSGTVGGIQSTVGNIQTGLTSLTATVGTISTGVQGLTNSMTGLTTSVGQAVTAANSASSQAANAVTAANNAVTAANNAKSAVDNTSTYVLVVAVLAAITVVLELAVLIRKLS